MRLILCAGAVIALAILVACGAAAPAELTPRAATDQPVGSATEGAGIADERELPDGSETEPIRVESPPAARVRVEAGCATIGGGTCTVGVAPPASARECVGAFQIDVYEVSVREYQACVDAGRCSGIDVSDAYRCSASRDNADVPMDCVSFTQAGEYCAFVGGRLPREAEWVVAAYGDPPRAFPWGDDPSRAEAVLCTSRPRFLCAPVARSEMREPPTPTGIRGLASGVAEWVDSPLARPERRVARGGSAGVTSVEELTACGRDENRDGGFYALGFRCAYDDAASARTEATAP